MAKIFGGDSQDRAFTKKLYASFKQKDMPYEEFHKQLNEQLDPIKMKSDLDVILAQKAGLN